MDEQYVNRLRLRGSSRACKDGGLRQTGIFRPRGACQACIDIINQQKVTVTNDPTDLLNRIDKQHGIHTIEHTAKIALDNRKYTLVDIQRMERQRATDSIFAGKS